MHAPGSIGPLLLLLATCVAHAWLDVPLAPSSSPHNSLRLRARQPQQHGRRPVRSSALDDLLGEYTERHRRCLHDPEHKGQYVVVSMGDAYTGLGNRMLSVVTGMLLALMTRRCLFLRHDSYLRDFRNEAGLDMDWWPHEAALAGRGRQVSWARLGPRSIWAMSDTDPLYAMADFTDLWANVTAVDIHYDNDYLVPLLLSNARYGPWFERHFPTREVFHGLAAFLFQLAPAHAAAAEAFRAANFGSPVGAFVIGLQIRTRKPIGLQIPPVGSFCTLARALALKQGLPAGQVRVFVAADSSEAVEAVQASLGTDFAVAAVDAGGAGRDAPGTAAANPGTEEAALLDMALLAGCDALVLTSGSSFGYVAAAWGGVVPLHVLHRTEGGPSMASPYFFRPLDSEPCYWGAHRYFLDKAPKEAAAAFLANPLWMQYAHCV